MTHWWRHHAWAVPRGHPLVTWPGSSSISLVWRHILLLARTWPPYGWSRLTAVDLGVTPWYLLPVVFFFDFRLPLFSSRNLIFRIFNPIWPLAWPHVTPFELGTLLFIPRPNRLFFIKSRDPVIRPRLSFDTTILFIQVSDYHPRKIPAESCYIIIIYILSPIVFSTLNN
jgi:hypothetical protein